MFNSWAGRVAGLSARAGLWLRTSCFLSPPPSQQHQPNFRHYFFSNAKAKMLEPDLRVNSQVSMPDGKNVAASEKEVEREMSRTKRRPDRMQATERAVKIQRFQGQTRSRESGIIRQDVKRKTCQGERVPRDGTVNDRYRQVVRLCSYRLSLFFIAFAPSETSATRLARTLLV